MNPIIRLRNERSVFSLRRGVRRARIGYLAAGTQAITTVEALEGHAGRTPGGRARALSALAAHENTMADLVTQCRWRNAEGHEAADHRDAATLLTLIASTEVAVGAHDRTRGPGQWEQVFGAVLDQLAGVADIGYRAEIATRLHIAAWPVLGSNVTETIACLYDAYVCLALAAAEGGDAMDALTDAERDELSRKNKEANERSKNRPGYDPSAT